MHQAHLSREEKVRSLRMSLEMARAWYAISIAQAKGRLSSQAKEWREVIVSIMDDLSALTSIQVVKEASFVKQRLFRHIVRKRRNPRPSDKGYIPAEVFDAPSYAPEFAHIPLWVQRELDVDYKVYDFYRQ